MLLLYLLSILLIAQYVGEEAYTNLSLLKLAVA
jgi:hypothetical protein